MREEVTKGSVNRKLVNRFRFGVLEGSKTGEGMYIINPGLG